MPILPIEDEENDPVKYAKKMYDYVKHSALGKARIDALRDCDQVFDDPDHQKERVECRKEVNRLNLNDQKLLKNC